MLHPTLWKECGNNLDLLLCIAKWCPVKQLLAFSRTCKYFASVQRDIALETFERSISRPVSISKNTLWRLARECQFPDKPHLKFLGDEMNYMIASRKEFFGDVKLFNGVYIDNCLYEYDPMVFKFANDYGDCNLFVQKFKITKQFCLFKCFNAKTEYHSSYDVLQDATDEVLKIQKGPLISKPRDPEDSDSDDDIIYRRHRYAILDLSRVFIYFLGVKHTPKADHVSSVEHYLLVEEVFKGENYRGEYHHNIKFVEGDKYLHQGYDAYAELPKGHYDHFIESESSDEEHNIRVKEKDLDDNPEPFVD